MIVLGIDPSLCNTGIAAVDLHADGERVIEASVVRTAPSAKKHRVLAGDDNARRVTEIARALDAAIAKHVPAALVIEMPGGSKGAKAAAALALSVGVVVTIATIRKLPLVQVQPLDVKRAMTGRKNADKDEVLLAVERRFPDLEWPADLPQGCWEHAADAVGAVVAALDSDALRMARRLAGAA